MRGQVLHHDPRTGTGLIGGDDGNRYIFRGTDVRSGSGGLSNGVRVDFVPEDGNARSIFIMPSSGSSGVSLNRVAGACGDRSRIVAAVLAFFLGWMGFHKFYLGYGRAGLVMLVASMGGFVLLGLPTLIMSVIALVECILYLTKSDSDFYETHVAHEKEWF
ncbi:TM2 domain-containing protein [Komagataeibacter sp. FNDCF1]|uniref:TM2 domain-containing protein n=1 Tax=Komagataeibacter sp. FNDCF1 TaxID=2878681 RepID=UPI001E6395D1|nr:TM2 domain-containing protein [Komagataeibacter sp. FNDCF1]MCE2565585.1 TM2 domain-containing protein [Komagataeibacter sp. FNDCF1]